VSDPDDKDDHDRFAAPRISTRPTVKLDPAMILGDQKASLPVALAYLELLGPWAVDAFREGLRVLLSLAVDAMLTTHDDTRADAIERARTLLEAIAKIRG
jgi:hypothetical protein